MEIPARRRTFLQSVVHVMANDGDIELFEPKDSLLMVPKKGDEGIKSFRRQAEELMMDSSKWTVSKPLVVRSRGHKHYKNVNKSGGVAYLSIGTVNISAKLATELQFKLLSNGEMNENSAPKSFKCRAEVIKEIDENTIVSETQLISPGGPCHSAWINMRDTTGGAGLVLQYSITKGPDGTTIKPLKTIDGKFKQAYGMLAFKFTPIENREEENVCEFRYLHQWWENKGHTDSKEDSEIVDSKSVPTFVAELIFRSQIKSLHRLAGLRC